jgi:2'-5' RNA ligase
VRPGNIHVTVRFLGDVDEGRIEPLRRRISEAYASERPFRVSIGPPGCFGPSERPQVLWFALREGAEELGRLVERTEAVVRSLRFEPERKPWKAHLTIARNPQGASWAAWRDVLGSWGLEGLGFDAREITCFESRLGPSGPTYTTLWKAPLGASETRRETS